MREKGHHVDISFWYCLHDVYFVSSYILRILRMIYKLKPCVSTCDFVIKDVSFELSVAVVEVLTECYPTRRYMVSEVGVL